MKFRLSKKTRSYITTDKEFRKEICEILKKNDPAVWALAHRGSELLNNAKILDILEAKLKDEAVNEFEKIDILISQFSEDFGIKRSVLVAIFSTKNHCLENNENCNVQELLKIDKNNLFQIYESS